MNHQFIAKHSLKALAHPLTIAAVFLLLLNALYLQPNAPSVLTGKLGDAAWMMIGPLVICLFLGLLVPRRVYIGEKRVILAGTLLFGLLFGVLKALPFANSLARGTAHALLGFPLKLALDPTDLLVLPIMGLAAWVWKDASRRNPAPGLRFAALGLALLAVIADAPAPTTLGITCLVEDGDTITALKESFTQSKDNVIWTSYESPDGGLTWGYNQAVKNEDVACGGDVIWPIPNPADPAQLFYYLTDKGIYSSTDGGQSLVLEYEMVGISVSDTAAHPPTGNLIFALGRHGVLTRTTSGEWVLTDADLMGTTQ